jgi:hypothetical protein
MSARTTQILWPSDRVAKFWRAVRAGRAVIVELVQRDDDGVTPRRAARDGEPA